MLKREDPSDTQIGRLTFLLFAHFMLMMYSQWWRVQVGALGLAEVPFAPWAVSGLLTVAAWSGIACCAGALSLRKLHKWMIRLPIAMAFLSIAAYTVNLVQGDSPDMNEVLAFFLLTMLPLYYALYVVFYVPLAGLVRLVPFLGVRMANTYDFEPMDPIAAIIICLVYLSVSTYCHTLGKRAWEKSQEFTPPNEPPEETECMDTPQE